MDSGTERAAQQASEYRPIFEAVEDGLIVRDWDGRIVDANPAWCRMHGYDRAELPQLDPEATIHPDYRHVLSDYLRNVRAGRSFHCRAVDVRKDGTAFEVEVRGKPFTYRGEPHILGIVRDITASIRAERALRASQAKFAKAFHASPDPMAITTLAEGRYVEVNDSFLETFEYRLHEVLGRTTAELNLWADRQAWPRIREALQAHRSVRNRELNLRARSGTLVTVMLSAEAIELEEAPHALIVATDITERKRAEAQRQLVAERDRLLHDIAQRIRRSLDLDRILNTTVAEIRGHLQAERVLVCYDYSAQAIAAESVHPDWQPALSGQLQDPSYRQHLQALYAPGRTYAVADAVTSGDAIAQPPVRGLLSVPLWLGDQLLGALIVQQYSGPRHWQPFEVDLLEQLATQVAIALQQAHLYQQVQTLNATLEQKVAQRTEQLNRKLQELQDLYQLKDAFLHAFSHDLRTPIMGTKLVLQRLLGSDGEAAPDPVPVPRSTLARMDQSSDRQLNRIDALLEAHASEIEGLTLHRQSLALPALVAGYLQDLEPLLERHEARAINLIGARLPAVSVDPTQLQRVFDNAITNALEHNAPGLSVILAAQGTASGWVRCTITDSGQGMSPSQRERLFELYARGKSGRAQLGLGLYLCRQIVEAHGGTIGAASHPGVGTTLWFTLPPAGAD
ncbi:MAG: histidine kinase [Cyanobacteria bacterium QS_8_64_29]|nr:MAG: histidine kinase [Cyanobacteria bacterium QS_8_64_29]